MRCRPSWSLSTLGSKHACDKNRRSSVTYSSISVFTPHPIPSSRTTKYATYKSRNIFLKKTLGKSGSYGNKILYKNLDLTQDFPNKISFHFLWVKMLPKNLPKIFRWPEMCPLDKILAQDFQMAAFTKILGRRDTSVVPLLSTENCKTLF